MSNSIYLAKEISACQKMGCAGSMKQVASAAGEGATAALLIREYLKTA